MYIALLMLLPLAIGIGGLIMSKSGRFDANLSLKEFAVMEAACLAIFVTGYYISRYSAVADTELVSGRVTGKERNTVSCSHSYSCNCRQECSGSGKDRSCSEVCDTCYKHSNDYDWDVYTSAMNQTVTIDRVFLDEQGVIPPPRWLTVRASDPVAFTHSYKNYIKADPYSVLVRRGVKTPQGLALPAYPNKVYDYYKAQRFLQIGLADPNGMRWNSLLMDMNADLGPSRQANVVVIEVKTADPSYEYLVQQEWLNGKKNDVIVLLGVNQWPVLDWVRVVSWTKSEELKVELRDALQAVGRVDNPDQLAGVIKSQVTASFQRRHFKDFEYLMASVQPGPVGTVILLILGLAVCVGLTVFFYRNDPFGDEGGGRSSLGGRRAYGAYAGRRYL